MTFPGLSIDQVDFPERKSISRSDSHLESVVEQVKKIDLDKSNFENDDFQPHTKIIQKQKVYFWIRVFIKDEIEIQPETKINIVYLDGTESVETHFMYYGKKGLERDKDGQIVNFNPEDDKKILCLLLDAERINVNNSDIPHMKTLFTLGKYYQPQYIKKFDYKFLLDDSSEIEFYDIEF
jgi:hypothetical protein